MAKVVNVRHEKPGSYVYIGREVPGFAGSEWGNPFKGGRDGTRAQVIAQYRKWLWAKIQADPGCISRLAALDGQDLGCWCKPLDCHGDVLLRAVAWAVKRQKGQEP